MYNILQLLMQCNKCLAMQMQSMCLCLSSCLRLCVYIIMHNCFKVPRSWMLEQHFPLDFADMIIKSS